MSYQDIIITGEQTLFSDSIEIFSGLTEEHIALFAPATELKSIEGRTVIFNENDRDDCLYIVKEGKVSVSFSLNVNTGTIRPIVRTVYRNGLVGELEFITACPRMSKAFAQEDTKLIKIERSAFWEIVDSHYEIGLTVMKNFNKILASGLCRSNKQLKTALVIGWNAYKFDRY